MSWASRSDSAAAEETQDGVLGRDRRALLLEGAGPLVVGGAPALEVEHLDGSVVCCPDPLGRSGRTGLEGVGVEVAEHRPEPLVFLLREREVGRRGGEGGLGSAGSGRGGLDRVGGGVVVLRHRDARVLDRTAHRQASPGCRAAPSSPARPAIRRARRSVSVASAAVAAARALATARSACSWARAAVTRVDRSARS